MEGESAGEDGGGPLGALTSSAVVWPLAPLALAVPALLFLLMRKRRKTDEEEA